MFVCVACNRQMRPQKNGFEFVELVPGCGVDRPYRLWSGDLWACQDCGARIIHTDPRQTPIAESYQPNFEERIQAANSTVTAKEWSRK
jgi:hypothetical protein